MVEVDGRACSVAPHLQGTPIGYEDRWQDRFGEALARLLLDLHRMPVEGSGPLDDVAFAANGISRSRRQGVVDRWFHASIWPFDGAPLDAHPLVSQAPELVDGVASLRPDIETAEAGPLGVVHSDLHREHLLVDADGSLAALLDFGDTFVGATAWDFALLNWQDGARNAELVASHYPCGKDELIRSSVLSIAVGLYKLAKNPSDGAILPRLRRCIDLVHGT